MGKEGGEIGVLTGCQGYLDLLAQLPVVERVEEVRGRRPGLRSGPLQPAALSGRCGTPGAAGG